jgi:pre-60S factor REI1
MNTLRARLRRAGFVLDVAVQSTSNELRLADRIISIDFLCLDASALEGETEVLGTPLQVEECLFCSLKSVNLEDNLSHMAHVHSFFLPDFEYISDLPGLIEYLGKTIDSLTCMSIEHCSRHSDEKVGIFHVCLWCNKRSFHDVLAVQRHMTAKGHCKVLFDDNPNQAWEYVDFYDYS